jgi:predicted metal-binding membrane protein
VSALVRDRTIVLGGLLIAIAVAWAYLLFGAGAATATPAMDMGDGMMMSMPSQWTPAHAGAMFVMWSTMMVAMMLPVAAPAILLVAALARQRAGSATFAPGVATFFTSGYLAVWFFFSAAATATQWGLDRAAALSPAMALANAVAASGVLVAAGVYQWTPLKETCLKHCSNPSAFLTRHWRAGRCGALETGLRHGLFCLGCCWLLMALLFVVGIMNVVWIGGIALLVLLEKTLPWRRVVTSAAGAALIVWGATIFVHTVRG